MAVVKAAPLAAHPKGLALTTALAPKLSPARPLQGTGMPSGERRPPIGAAGSKWSVVYRIFTPRGYQGGKNEWPWRIFLRGFRARATFGGRVHTYTSSNVIESQVDWLTITARHNDRSVELYTCALNLLSEELTLGNRVRPWGTHGYKGFICGEVAQGVRGLDQIVQVSGGLAALSWDSLIPFASNITRIDIQVTARHEAPDAALAREGYATRPTKLAKRGKLPIYRLYQDSKRGETLYIGSAKSEVQARLYDKGIESGAAVYANCWRYELECKGKIAAPMAAAIAGAGDGCARIASIVRHHFSTRGVEPTWESRGIVLSPYRQHRRPDTERSLDWLRCQVKSTVGWLIQQGEEDRMIEALGLGWLMEARMRGTMPNVRHLSEL